MIQSKRARLRRQKCRLFSLQDGRCCWCNRHMFLTFKETNPQPDDMATLDHLDHKLSEDRGKHAGEVRHVLACRKCNLERGEADRKRYEKQNAINCNKADIEEDTNVT